MRGYQPLTSEIQVPEEWPVEALRFVIIEVVQFAIKRHLLGKRVVIVIGKVFAVVTDNLNRPGFLLKKIARIDDERTYKIIIISEKGERTYKIEEVVPIKTVMSSLKPSPQGPAEAESVQLLPCNLKSQHPISTLLHGRFNSDKVFTVVPDLRRVLQLKGITGPKMYDHVLLTTYRINNIKSLFITLPSEEPGTSAGTSSTMDQVADDQWDVVYLDCLMQPKRRWCIRKATVIWIFCFLVLVGVILYLIV